MNGSAEQSQRVRVIHGLWRLSWIGALLLALVGLSRESVWGLVVLGLLVIGPGLSAVARWAQGSGRDCSWLAALAVLNVLLVVPELALRLGDFRYEWGIQFGSPRPSAFARMLPHEKLFWTYDPAEEGVNSLGFRGPEVTTPKPDSTYRIVFLGDSCTEQGFPRFVEFELNESPPAGERHVECIPLAIYGYSSHQGRAIAELYADRLDADLVVVYYGWNDHWLAYGAVDAEKVIRTSRSTTARAAQRVYRASRLLQGVMWTLAKLRPAAADAPLTEVRVPPDRYSENLEFIADRFAVVGAGVVFVTAPTSHDCLGVPEHLIELNFAKDSERVLALHGEYNGIVRHVAAKKKALVVDLAAELAAVERPEVLFMADGIHFTPVGLAYVGRRVAEFIRTAVWEQVGAQAAGSAGSRPWVPGDAGQ